MSSDHKASVQLLFGNLVFEGSYRLGVIFISRAFTEVSLLFFKQLSPLLFDLSSSCTENCSIDVPILFSHMRQDEVSCT